MREQEIAVLRIDTDTIGGRCRAIVGVRIQSTGVVINGIRVLERDDGSIYASLPYGKTRRGEYYQVIHLPAALDSKVKAAAVDAYSSM